MVCVALAAPASATAHARSATVALDYRLVLDEATRRLPGVTVAILDGDRTLRVRVRRTTVVVEGDLGEPMLRLAAAGAWANRASPTAVSAHLVPAGRGWARVAGGGTYVWHEHRLSPPPYSASRAGVVGRFTIPITVDGSGGTITGTFVQARRPDLVPWLAGGIVAAGAAAFAGWRRPRSRRPLAVGLGGVAGLAALTGLVSFNAADAPSGRVAWAQIVLGLGLAAVVYGALVRARGVRRAHLAGVLGAVAAAVSLGSLGVFRHGVVVSLLPAMPSRLLCAAALVCGASAAVAGLSAEERR